MLLFSFKHFRLEIRFRLAESHPLELHGQELVRKGRHILGVASHLLLVGQGNNGRTQVTCVWTSKNWYTSWV